MSESHEVLVPDYYASFACKMGACRTACCEGWPISFSMTDYFRLLGVACSPDMRRKLDCAMHLVEHPTQDEYAQITPRYDGQCPLRLEDGRCGLHAELGDGALAAVCRLYPRGVRRDGSEYECSCANSCEAVLELLWQLEEPLNFQKQQITIELPPAAQRRHHFETAGRAQEIRLWLISKMQQRQYPLPQRLLLLGEALRAMDEALQAKDSLRVEQLLSGTEQHPVPAPVATGREQLAIGLEAAEKMLAMMDQHSDSIRSYGEAVLKEFTPLDQACEQYAQAQEHFAALAPKWEIWFEHMLVNHMFFAQFPFQDRPVPLKDEFLALCAVYVLLRFLCVGWMASRTAQEDLVDVAAAVFRLVEHTEFDRYAAYLLKNLHCDDWSHLRPILGL